MSYNPSQLKAVSHREGPAMILAGPGSGKTTVITARVRFLTDECHIEPEHILVVTFTNAAASEMKERYLKLTDREKTGVTFGTFHAVFLMILKAYYRGRSFELVTDNEKYRIMTEIFRENFRDIETDNELFSGLLSQISAIKNNGGRRKGNTPESTVVDIAKIVSLYDEKKRQLKRIDFDDMLLMTREVLRNSPETLAFWRERFQWIMIDEFQDINPVQYEIIKMLAHPRNNLFIVGDDDQSVYRFRGAEPQIMLGFPKDYPGCENTVLDVNYRSNEEIVKASLKLISHNKERYKKKLNSFNGKGGKIDIRQFKTEAEESAWLSASVEEELKKGTAPHEIAVLFRTNNSMQPVISALTEKGLPFWSRDRVRNVYRHFILKPVYALVNWMGGNHTRDNFLKFMNCPNRFIRREELSDRIIDLDALKAWYEASEARQYMAEKVRFLQYQLDMLSGITLPYAMLNFIRKFMAYDEYVQEYAVKHHMEEDSLLAVLEEIQEDAKPFRTVQEWYAHIAVVTRKLESEEQGSMDGKQDHLFLSTFHSAKGLEFQSVYIFSANEKVTPHEKAMTPEDLEEERRMFYVAVTRAARNLTILSAQSRYGKKAEESRYVRELK